MNGRKRWILIIGPLFLILSLAAMAGAQQRKQVRAGLKNEVAQSTGVNDLIRGLRLTDTQRADIKAILQTHRAEMLENRKSLLQAQLAMAKEDPEGPGQFGMIQTRLMQMRLQILAEIKSKLTADQLTLLQKRQQTRANRIQRKLEAIGKKQN